MSMSVVVKHTALNCTSSDEVTIFIQIFSLWTMKKTSVYNRYLAYPLHFANMTKHLRGCTLHYSNNVQMDHLS